MFGWILKSCVEEVCSHSRSQYPLVVIGRPPTHLVLQRSEQLFEELPDRFLSAPSQGLTLVGSRSGQGWPKATAKRQGLDGDKPDVPSLAAKDGLELVRCVRAGHRAACGGVLHVHVDRLRWRRSERASLGFANRQDA